MTRCCCCCCCRTGWLGAMSTGVALLLSPVTIAFCRRKSTRLTAVMGGLITALGCLFTSFATQFHQLFFSYGTVIGKRTTTTVSSFLPVRQTCARFTFARFEHARARSRVGSTTKLIVRRPSAPFFNVRRISR